MKHAITTRRMLFAALVLAFAASTIWVRAYGARQPGYTRASHVAVQSANPGFSSAFGEGTVVRNLLW